MINRDKWGNLYERVRGEILGSVNDKQLRKPFAKLLLLSQELEFGD
jgi:hypothetical protein